MKEEMEQIYNKSFEEIKHTDENGVEFWYARELMEVLKYSKWENFKKVIKKAMDACQNSGMSTKDCFPEVRKSIISGKGKEDFILDYKLTRYSCYLIAQNGGTMPEELPTPEKSLKQLEKENKQKLVKHN